MVPRRLSIFSPLRTITWLTNVDVIIIAKNSATTHPTRISVIWSDYEIHRTLIVYILATEALPSPCNDDENVSHLRLGGLDAA